nr:hypothetical protein [Tanacetum cinerariifolium]
TEMYHRRDMECGKDMDNRGSVKENMNRKTMVSYKPRESMLPEKHRGYFVSLENVLPQQAVREECTLDAYDPVKSTHFKEYGRTLYLVKEIPHKLKVNQRILLVVVDLNPSSFSDNGVPSCSKACSKAYAQLRSQYDKLTDEFRKSRIDVLSYQAGLESVEARLVVYKQNESILEENIIMLKNEVKARDNVLTNDKHGLGYFSSESDSESLSPSSLSDRMQPSGGYHVVPPLITGTFMPLKPNLVFHTAPIAIETDHSDFTVQISTVKPTQDLSHTNTPSAPIFEEWVSNFEDESETTAPQIAPSFVQSSKHVKPYGHSVQPVETSIPVATLKPTSLKFNRSSKRKNRKTCFVCKSVDNLIKDCDYHAKKKAQPTPRNYAHRGNHKQYASLNHKKLQNHMAPTAVLTQSKPVFNTAVRPVSAAMPKIMVTRPRLAHSPVTKCKSPIRRHITRSPSPKTSNSSPKVTAVKALVVSTAQGMKGK